MRIFGRRNIPIRHIQPETHLNVKHPVRERNIGDLFWMIRAACNGVGPVLLFRKAHSF